MVERIKLDRATAGLYVREFRRLAATKYGHGAEIYCTPADLFTAYVPNANGYLLAWSRSYQTLIRTLQSISSRQYQEWLDTGVRSWQCDE